MKVWVIREQYGDVLGVFADTYKLSAFMAKLRHRGIDYELSEHELDDFDLGDGDQ